jgi:hypothetical protein
LISFLSFGDKQVIADPFVLSTILLYPHFHLLSGVRYSLILYLAGVYQLFSITRATDITICFYTTLLDSTFHRGSLVNFPDRPETVIIYEGKVSAPEGLPEGPRCAAENRTCTDLRKICRRNQKDGNPGLPN